MGDGSWSGTAPTSCCDIMCDSQIMTPPMATQLSTWMAEKGLTNANGWALCYSSPRGDPKNAASQFHSRCDNKPKTVSVGSYNDQVFGGYADYQWNHNGYVDS